MSFCDAVWRWLNARLHHLTMKQESAVTQAYTVQHQTSQVWWQSLPEHTHATLLIRGPRLSLPASEHCTEEVVSLCFACFRSQFNCGFAFHEEVQSSQSAYSDHFLIILGPFNHNNLTELMLRRGVKYLSWQVHPEISARQKRTADTDVDQSVTPTCSTQTSGWQRAELQSEAAAERRQRYRDLSCNTGTSWCSQRPAGFQLWSSHRDPSRGSRGCAVWAPPWH